MLSQTQFNLTYKILQKVEKLTNLLPLIWEDNLMKARKLKWYSVRATWWGHSLLFLNILFLIYRIHKCYPDQILQILPNTIILIIHFGTFAARSAIWDAEDFADLFNMASCFNQNMRKFAKDLEDWKKFCTNF